MVFSNLILSASFSIIAIILFVSMAVFGVLSFRTKFHQRFPKTFSTLVIFGVLSFSTLAAYKYLEGKAQSQEILQDFGFTNGINVVGFSRLERPSGIFYSSGDILVGADKKMRVKKEAIDSEKIANKSVENEDLSDNAVNSRIIQDGSIVGADISPEADLTIDSLNVLELISSGGVDMQGNTITNIGNFGTDFTTSGGLNLAGNLAVNTRDLFVKIENGYVGLGTSEPIEKLTLDGNLAILEGGSNPQHYTIFKGGNQSEDIIYILPETSRNGMLVNKDGELEWDEDDYMRSHAGIDYAHEVASNSAPNAGTISVPANSATFYTDANRDDFVHVHLAAAPVLHLVDDVQNFIIADRETETFVVTVDEDLIDYVRYLPYAEAFKRSGNNNIHTQLAPMFGNGEIETHHERVAKTDRYARESGLDEMSVDSSLNLTINAGYVWAVNTRYYIEPVTSETRNFKCYHNSSGDWAISSVKGPKINNTQYDDGYGMVEAEDGRYLINYIYRGIENEDHVYMVYGNQGYGSLEEAKAAGIIGNLPEIITTHAVLVGRIIVQKDQSEIVAEDAFVQKFSGASSVTTHSALVGLDLDDHAQYALLDGRPGGQILTGGAGDADSFILRTTSGNASPGADMIFQTGNNGATEAMRILNSGNVGIGTNAPVGTLDVYKDYGSGADSRMTFGDVGSGYALNIQANDKGIANLNHTGIVSGDVIYIGDSGTNTSNVLHIESGSPGSIMNIESLGITSNDFMYMQHYASAFSGDFLHAELAKFGGGSFTGDFLDFYNADVSKFKVDSNGQVSASDGFIHKTNAGACDDTLFATDTDGNICIDSTNGRIYFRYDGAWHYSAQTAGFQIPNYESQNIKPGDLLMPYAEYSMEDGAIHGLYAKFSDMKDQMFGEQISQIENLNLQLTGNITTVTELKNSINTQLGSIEKNLSEIANDQDTITNQISNINTQVTNQENKITTLESLATTLQVQIATLQSQIATPVNIAQIDANTQSIDYLNQLLGITPTGKAGDITIVGKLTSQITETGQLVINVSDNPNAPTVGKDVIKTGDKKVVIKTEAVDTDSNIFVTISKADKIVPIKAGNITKNKSFEVEVDDVATSDIEFSWFVVNEK